MKSPLVALSPHQLLAVLGIVVAAPHVAGRSVERAINPSSLTSTAPSTPHR